MEFFSGFFFHGNRNSTEKVLFFASIIKRNSQNNCVKSFPFHRYKQKKVSLLAASWKDSIFGFQKNSIKCKALFPQWNPKTCIFYGVLNTEEQFDLPRKLIPVAYRFLKNPMNIYIFILLPSYFAPHFSKIK